MARRVWVVRSCGALALAAALLPLSGRERDAGARDGAPPVTARFVAAADASVEAARPRARHGAARSLTVRGAPRARAYLRFAVRLGGRVERATLRLYALRGSKAGIQVRAVAPGAWREASLTYARAPRLVRGRSGISSGRVRSHAWIEVDVTAMTRRSKPVTLAVTTRARRALRFASRESALKPTLVIKTAGTDRAPPPAPAAPPPAPAAPPPAPAAPPPSPAAPPPGDPTSPGTVTPTPTPTTSPVPTPAISPYRFAYHSDSDPAAAAAQGWNLLDAGSKWAADAVPEGTRALVWVGDYDNTTCDWERPDAALTSDVESMADDPKVAGFFFSDEPDPDACPDAPARHAARTRLLHALAPSKIAVMVMDANSGQASLDQIPRWVGAADFVGLDPYPCSVRAACDFAWIDAVIAAADRAGLRYWGVVQAFADSVWRWPTAAELEYMLSQWAGSNQSGSMTFAWEWAGNALTSRPDLLAVLRRFNGLPPLSRG